MPYTYSIFKMGKKMGEKEEHKRGREVARDWPWLLTTRIDRLVLVTVPAWSGVQGSQRVCVSVCLSLEWSLQSQTLSCPKLLLNPKCSIEKESRTDRSIYFHSVVWRKECGGYTGVYKSTQAGNAPAGWQGMPLNISICFSEYVCTH